MRVAVVSPGAMGSAVAATLVRGGATVLATLADRSERTTRLAHQVELSLRDDLASVVRDADVVLSIVPPAAASEIAEAVARVAADARVTPVYVELNAISPARAGEIEEALRAAGVELVDGSISGPPPWRPGTTRVYLSGPRAREIAALPFEGVERIVVAGGIGAASAVKMCTASVYKGTSAILAHALLTARAYGVLDHVLDDLRDGAPALLERVGRRLATAAAKSERYVDEMHEIAAAQAGADLTPALFDAIADVFATLSESPSAGVAPEDVPADATLATVLAGLTRDTPSDEEER